MKTVEEIITRLLKLGCFVEDWEITRIGLLDVVREIQDDARQAGLEAAPDHGDIQELRRKCSQLQDSLQEIIDYAAKLQEGLS